VVYHLIKKTIKDVANKAGVSIATVSRVINEVSSVTPEMRSKVWEAIGELDFRPNQLAQGLKSDITHTIGVIISDISNPFFMSIIREIEKKINEVGYNLLIVSSADDPEKERKDIKTIIEKRVDGIIISSTGQNEDYLSSIVELGVPVIIIDRKPFRNKFDAVYVDKALAMYEIANYLLTKGHRRISIVMGPRYIMSNFDRFSGYARCMQAANILLDNDLIIYGEFSEAFGRLALNNIIKMKNRPTAIISSSVQITRGILMEAKELGLSIPDDFSLVSYGNIEMSTLISPSLTYVESLNEKIGAVAGDLILNRIKDPEGNLEQKVFESKLILGDSVKEFVSKAP